MKKCNTKDMARGGRVNVAVVGAGSRMVPKPGAGGAESPITTARRNNGIPGMKKGGKCGK